MQGRLSLRKVSDKEVRNFFYVLNFEIEALSLVFFIDLQAAAAD